MSGTWVQVGDLRLSAISAAAPAIQDAVVTGHDRERSGLLIFPESRRLPQDLQRAGCPVARTRHAARAARAYREGFRRIQRGQSRIEPTDCARPVVMSDAAFDRRQRDHRQGLHQSARGSGRPRRGGVGRLYSGTAAAGCSPHTARGNARSSKAPPDGGFHAHNTGDDHEGIFCQRHSIVGNHAGHIAGCRAMLQLKTQADQDRGHERHVRRLCRFPGHRLGGCSAASGRGFW